MVNDLYYIAKNWQFVNEEAHEYFKKCLIEFSQDKEINNYNLEVIYDKEVESYKIYKFIPGFMIEIFYLYDADDNWFQKYCLCRYCDLCDEDIDENLPYYNNIEKELDMCGQCALTEDGKEFIITNELII